MAKANDLKIWALPRLQRLLPIDNESLTEIIVYSSSLSKEAGAEHLKNMLGDSPQALEFISSFNARRSEASPGSRSSLSHNMGESAALSDEGVPSPRKGRPKKTKPPLHSAGEIRRPEGYGNVSGGYTKSNIDEDYLIPKSKSDSRGASLSDSLSLSNQPEALQLPTPTNIGDVHSRSQVSSRDPSPPRQRLPPSASGMLISDLPNVRTKQFKKPIHSGTSSPQKFTTTTTTSNIADLTSAIAALEVSTNPSLSSERRKCPCNASIHPLFTTAPNCLSCGKIICALEGLQPCSFCDKPILSKDQVNGMIRALKEERGQERMATHNAAVAPHSGRGTPNLGGFGGTTPESSGDETSEAATRARAHRDKLLSFQRENAQRTRIHDEAADYDMSLTPGSTQWMSPVQRAAALKKQQKYMREMEEQNKPEWEKRKTVMSMSIKNGKLVKTFETVKASAPKDKEVEIHHEDESLAVAGESARVGGKGRFSDNPLLASGKLIRPIWKAPEGEKGKGRADGEPDRPRQSVWRRVQQDEYADNEELILDGGVYGFSNGIEDGSGQECG